MSDLRLRALAEAAGIAAQWTDAAGETHRTPPDVMRTLLAALDLASESPAQIEDSIAALAAEEAAAPLVTGVVGEPTALPGERRGPWRVALEHGGTLAGEAEGRLTLPPIGEPGYHRLECAGGEITLAIAPPACFGLTQTTAGPRAWGLAAQLYGLRRGGDGGLGDLGALARLARGAARRGAAAIAISPLHALFAADPRRYSPYAPSSRLFLNALHADPAILGESALAAAVARSGVHAMARQLEALDLVDWPAASRLRLSLFRALYEGFPGDPEFDRFRAEEGEALESHARFEALHAHLLARDPARWHWRDWPPELRDPRGAGVAQFAEAHAAEVRFHAFLQWIARRSLAAAQEAARGGGAAIGLIADLAVGADGAGSQAWSRQAEILSGVSIGAPPDALGPLGQDWGVAAFSPRGLRRGGHRAFLEMLRAAMRSAGGLRIDHVMGLGRLWLVPQGATPRDGAYLGYALQDQLRLLALESWRHRCIVVGEDLGTVPAGFRELLGEACIMGLRVLWFERDAAGGFVPPARWTRDAVAVTTTHDLPTVAGWWEGRDLAWRARLNLIAEQESAAGLRAARARDRRLLWRALRESGAATGRAPAASRGDLAAHAAAQHVGSAACALALLPLEDALGLTEQPNLPGTVETHPNWRRRLPVDAAGLLDRPAVAARLAAFSRGRRGS